MVSCFFMTHLRRWVPLLGLFALVLLFFKLPETPNLFGIFKCKSCSSSTSPYLPLIASAYFAALVAISLVFPNFPRSKVATAGLVWAILLAIALTYINLPSWCAICLIAHLCHILIWIIWLVFPFEERPSSLSFMERLTITLLAPISVVALFSSLNLTFMAYEFKSKNHLSSPGLNLNDAVPYFEGQTTAGHSIINSHSDALKKTILNFVAPNCPYCKEQLQVINSITAMLDKSSYRIINISPSLSPEMLQEAATKEWLEDKDGALRTLFKVAGYPTLFIIGPNGRFAQIIEGAPDNLQTNLLAILSSK